MQIIHRCGTIIPRDIMCTETLTCTEFHRSWWMQMRDHTNSIIAYMRRHSFPYKDVELSNEQLLSSQYSLKLRPMLCKEEQSAGFLLDSRSESWPIRCLWTGNDLNATCAPAPPRNSSIYYIAPNVWRKQVRVCLFHVLVSVVHLIVCLLSLQNFHSCSNSH
ncbi:unnamed protein product [Gongylonema pulchrum]|uniref:IL4_i_Ig domain-containing protein n=1 Tax=Gongylonema pulchrum TaxID=637853 RepID=A0A183DIL7_9BILA|nr:unnamed protein product [Gongylonema pulchrum]